MRFIEKKLLLNTNRHVQNEAYNTVRFLLEDDGFGVTITDITLAPDIEETYGYDQHIEFAYCLDGRATIVDLATHEATEIRPGTLWIAEKGDRFRFRAHQPTRLICVFTPPFKGDETGFAGDQ